MKWVVCRPVALEWINTDFLRNVKLEKTCPRYITLSLRSWMRCKLLCRVTASAALDDVEFDELSASTNCDSCIGSFLMRTFSKMFARHVNYAFLDRVQCTLLSNNISNILWKINKIIWKKCVFARKYLAYLAVDNKFPDAPWKLSIRMAVKKILLWQCYWSQQRLLSSLVAVMVRHNEKCS